MKYSKIYIDVNEITTGCGNFFFLGGGGGGLRESVKV